MNLVLACTQRTSQVCLEYSVLGLQDWYSQWGALVQAAVLVVGVGIGLLLGRMAGGG